MTFQMYHCTSLPVPETVLITSLLTVPAWMSLNLLLVFSAHSSAHNFFVPLKTVLGSCLFTITKTYFKDPDSSHALQFHQAVLQQMHHTHRPGLLQADLAHQVPQLQSELCLLPLLPQLPHHPLHPSQTP